MQIKDSVALVTASSKGLGRATALQLAREGAKVVLCARGQDALHATRDEIAALGADVLAVPIDVSAPDAAQTLVDATLERARLAVEGRAHLLLRYDPGAPGLFGLRASLEGNPGPEKQWGGASFAEWAAGEARFAPHFEALEGDGDLPLDEWLALAETDRRSRVPFVEIDERRLAVSRRMARAAGEVAPLMLTGATKIAPVPTSGDFPYVHLDRQFMHLGFHIYDLGFQSPNVEAVKPLVFATALLLVLVVLVTNVSAILLRNHLREKYATQAV